MNKIKIYTKKGDKGKTRLGNGKEVWKDDQRVKAYGALDELNSLIGMVISQLNWPHEKRKLQEIQGDLMGISAVLANPPVETRYSVSLQSRTGKLEQWIDIIEKDLPPLKNFILPGGSSAASLLHYCRAVCRRAEREVVTLSKTEAVDKQILQYLNRLSDFFFILARWINKKDIIKDNIWKTQSGYRSISGLSRKK